MCAQSFGSAKVEVTVNNCLVTGVAGKALQRAYHGPQMRKELCKKLGWDAGQSDCIGWDSFGSVTRNLEDIYRNQLFKMAHSALPVLHQQKWCNYSSMTKCPRCETDKETIPYMLRCTLQHTETWKKDLQDNLLTAGIGPQTRALIIHLIKCFATNKEYNIYVE